MTIYNVHIYREMRLTFKGIEAKTPNDAAAIARDGLTSDADDIDDYGKDVSAVIEVVGDKECEQSRMIDFDFEQQRRAAPKLLALLEALLPYAENEAYCLDKLKDSPEAEAEAGRAWKAIESAQAAIAEAKAVGITPAPAEPDVDALLAQRRQIAVIWDVEDVESIRPDLTEDQCWEVLQHAKRRHDAGIGINWEVLECHAETLFGFAPDTDEAEEA